MCDNTQDKNLTNVLILNEKLDKKIEEKQERVDDILYEISELENTLKELKIEQSTLETDIIKLKSEKYCLLSTHKEAIQNQHHNTFEHITGNFFKIKIGDKYVYYDKSDFTINITKFVKVFDIQIDVNMFLKKNQNRDQTEFYKPWKGGNNGIYRELSGKYCSRMFLRWLVQDVLDDDKTFHDVLSELSRIATIIAKIY